MDTACKKIMFDPGKPRISLFAVIFSMTVVFTGADFAGGAPPAEEWNKTFGGQGGEVVHSFRMTSDGGYIFEGTTTSYGAGGGWANVWVVKTDAKGNEQWNITIGEMDDDRAEYIMQASDGGYLVAGNTENHSAGFSKIWLVKTDGYGKERWKKSFGDDMLARQTFGNYNFGDYNDIERSIGQTPDGGFIILWNAGPCGDCPGDGHLTKIDRKGQDEWDRILGNNEKEAYSFYPSHDGGFILAGSSKSGRPVVWLEKADSKGNGQWNRTFNGTGDEKVIAVKPASDDGYIIAGKDSEHSKGRSWLIKTDPNGMEQWKKTYGAGEDYYTSLFFQKTRDGGYVTGSNQWLLKVDSKGNLLWSKSITGIVITSAQETKDGGYILGGTTRYSSDHFGSYSLVKIDSNGNQQWLRALEDEFIPGPLFRWASTAAQTPDGGYIIAGSSQSMDRNPDFKLIKLMGAGSPSAPQAPAAIFSFDPEYPGVNQTVIFDARISYDPDGYIKNYRWDFGDGTAIDTAERKATHKYALEGEIIMRLTVTDNNGASNSTLKKIAVQRLPSPEETWNMTFGGHAGAKYAAETKDRRFIIAGESASEGTAYSWLLKVDVEGKELWNRSYSGMGLTSVEETLEGGVVASGNTLPSGDIWVVKIDSNGNERWNRRFAGEGFDQAGSVSPTADEGFIITGSYASSNNEHSDAWVVKIDSNGTKQWDRRFTGGAGRNLAMGSRQTADGGYIIVGTMQGIYSDSVWLIRVDSNGNDVWARTFDTEGLDYGGSVSLASDGGFLISGTSIYITYPSTYSDAWLMKTDSEGKELWKKSFFRVNGNAWPDPLFSTKDSSYLFSTIVHERPDNYEYDEMFYMIFVKTDPNGNLLWQKRENGFSSIRQTTDGGYVVVKDNRLVKLGGAKPEKTLSLPESVLEQHAEAQPGNSGLPGFGYMFAVAGLMLAVYTILMKKRK